MYQKISLNIIFIFGLAVAQAALISGLPGWLSAVNLILIALIFVLSLNDLELAFWYAIGAGWLLGIISFLPFGLNMTTLALVTLLIYFLLNYLLTNRSLYSFVMLTIISTFAYEILYYILLYIDKLFINLDIDVPIFNVNFFKFKLFGLFLNMIFVVVIFNVINFFSYRLRPVFLAKKK